MNFLSYLNESIVKNVKNIPQMKMECSEYLGKISQCNGQFYRGTKLRMETMRKVRPRADRRPRDTKQYVHDQFDIKFQKKFGWKPRTEGVMVVSNINTAGGYSEDAGGGPPCIFFPTNGFKYIWSPKIVDFFVIVRDMWPWEGHHDEMLAPGSRIATINKDVLEMFKNRMIATLNMIDQKQYIKEVKSLTDTDRMSDIVADAIVETYTDKDMCHAVDMEVETIFLCDDYYLVSQFFVDKLDFNL